MTSEEILQQEKEAYKCAWGASHTDMQNLVPNEIAIKAMESYHAAQLSGAIKARAHQITPNKKWTVWAEDGKSLPTQNSFAHFDILIIVKP